MPHSDDPVDFGIEEVRLSDGAVLTRAALLLAAGAHDLNPNAAGTVTSDIVNDNEFTALAREPDRSFRSRQAGGEKAFALARRRQADAHPPRHD